MKNFLLFFPWAIFFTRLVLMPIVFVVHGIAHALAATLLGDPSPREDGRLTLDPRRHLDHFGALLTVLLGIGWSRAVHLQPHKMRGNQTIGGMIVVLAGPLANALCVIIGLLAMRALNLSPAYPYNTWPSLAEWLSVFVRLNLAVALVNLLPLYPLDGYALIATVLPLPTLARWQILSGRSTLVLGIGVLLVLLMPATLLNVVYWPIIRAANHTFLGW